MWLCSGLTPLSTFRGHSWRESRIISIVKEWTKVCLMKGKHLFLCSFSLFPDLHVQVPPNEIWAFQRNCRKYFLRKLQIMWLCYVFSEDSIFPVLRFIILDYPKRSPQHQIIRFSAMILKDEKDLGWDIKDLHSSHTLRKGSTRQSHFASPTTHQSDFFLFK